MFTGTRHGGERQARLGRLIPAYLRGHLVLHHLVLHDPVRFGVRETPDQRVIGRPGRRGRKCGSRAGHKRCGSGCEGWLRSRGSGGRRGRSESGLRGRSWSRFRGRSRGGLRSRRRSRNRRGLRPLVNADGVDAAASRRGVAGTQGWVCLAAEVASYRALELLRSAAETLSW